MRMKRIAVACVALVLAVGAYTTAREAKEAVKGPALVHSVFFSVRAITSEMDTVLRKK